MDARDGIRLAELLAAISLATDLGRGFPQEKALRTCLIAHHLSEELGLDRRARSDIFYASLIHPVGCTAFTHEAARRFGTNELVGIPAYARVDTTRVTEGVRAMREEVRGEPVGLRVRAMAKGLTAGRRFLDYVVRADCEAGMSFTRRIGLEETVATIVGQTHERWDGKGLPAGLAHEGIEPGARVIALADQGELFHRTEGRADTLAMLRRRAGGWFDPSLAGAFERRADEIFDALEAGSVWDAVLVAEPLPFVSIPESRVDDLAEALADVVDLKSPYFLGHSRGVARLAEDGAARLGLGEGESSVLRRAALLSDLGRVGVPNRV